MDNTAQKQTDTNKRAEGGENPIKALTVTVNNRPVTFTEHKATGLEIKQTAISQGVSIQVDFALFEVKGQGNLKPVVDNDVVTLHPHQVFRATAPDDISY